MDDPRAGMIVSKYDTCHNVHWNDVKVRQQNIIFFIFILGAESEWQIYMVDPRTGMIVSKYDTCHNVHWNDVKVRQQNIIFFIFILGAESEWQIYMVDPRTGMIVSKYDACHSVHGNGFKGQAAKPYFLHIYTRSTFWMTNVYMYIRTDHCFFVVVFVLSFLRLWFICMR